MRKTDLAEAVESFAAMARSISDADMERDWPWRGADADIRWGFYRPFEALRDLAASLEAERGRKGPPMTVAQRALSQYHAAFRDLQALVLDFGDEEVDRLPGEGEWPLRTIFGHMMNTERAFLAMTDYAVQEHRAGRPPTELARERVTEYGDTSTEGTFQQILGRFATLHQRVLSDLTPLTDEDLQAVIKFWYEAHVRFQIYRFEAHLREHTIQVEKLLEAIHPRPNDALRTMRLIYDALALAEGATLGAPSIGNEQTATVAASIATVVRELAGAATG